MANAPRLRRLDFVDKMIRGRDKPYMAMLHAQRIRRLLAQQPVRPPVPRPLPRSKFPGYSAVPQPRGFARVKAAAAAAAVAALAAVAGLFPPWRRAR